MIFNVKSPQDFGAGILFMLIGLAGIYFGSDLVYGTAVRMGPGFFPMWLSCIILIMGAGLAIRSLVIEGEPIEPVQLRPLAGVVGAILVFGALITRFGTPITVVALTFVAAFARPNPSIKETLLLGIGLAVFAVVAFILALGQPLPLWWDFS